MYQPYCFFFSSRRRHTRYIGDWSSDVCSSDLSPQVYGGRCARRNDHRTLEAMRSAPRSILFTLAAACWLAGGPGGATVRSEERRVGKECSSWWWPGPWIDKTVREEHRTGERYE